ncbi:MAG: hypothetical protein H6713_12840 [Myxococcales bacterium]|nr:hypothetical protein [Myxococcales bacterium]
MTRAAPPSPPTRGGPPRAEAPPRQRALDDALDDALEPLLRTLNRSALEERFPGWRPPARDDDGR